MRIVEFVGVVVALMAVLMWAVGRRHTLESVERTRSDAAARAAADDADAHDAGDSPRDPGDRSD